MMSRFRICAALVLALCPLLVQAVPTGLNLMPTAEALGLGSTRFDFETDGSGKLYVPSGSSLVGSQAGALLGIEGGADQLSPGGTVYNLKWVFKSEGLILPAIAVGAQGIKSGERTEYYAVATKSLVPTGIIKVSGGVMRDNNGDNLLLLGAGLKVGMLMVKADRVSGGDRDAQALSAGLAFKNLTFTGTHYDFKNASDTNTLTVSYGYSAPFSR